jgi:hypothetical protein
MKRTIKYSLVLALTLTTLNSCFKEYLEPDPQTTMSDLVAFDTKERIVAQVNGLYASFRSGQYLGGRFQVYNDIRSNDFLNRQNNGVTGLGTWNHTITASANEVQNLWGQFYRAINRTNLFLEGIVAADPVSKGIISQIEYDQYRGEALALRGLAHFHLAMLYAWPYNFNPQAPGVVLRTVANKIGGDNVKQRSSLVDTYIQILNDLNASESLLPNITAGTANNVSYVTRIHKNTLIAIKTKVYLHMNDWPNVIAEANKIVPAAAPFNAITGVNNGLASSFSLIFQVPYTSSESMFSMPFTYFELPGTQNGLAHYFSASTVGNNEYSLNTAADAIWSNAAFSATDARKQLSSGTGANQYIRKYITFPHSDYAPVVRWAEILLNLAEAEALNDWALGQNRAVALLNAVFLRSNPTSPGFTTADFASADAFVARLLLERNIEFLGEGQKSMDVTRKLGTFAAKGTAGSVAINDIRYVWPIPKQS